MDAETPAANVPTMKLVMVAENSYSAKMKPLTIVNNDSEGAALVALITRSGAKAQIIEVPVWPNIVKEED